MNKNSPEPPFYSCFPLVRFQSGHVVQSYCVFPTWGKPMLAVEKVPNCHRAGKASTTQNDIRSLKIPEIIIQVENHLLVEDNGHPRLNRHFPLIIVIAGREYCMVFICPLQCALPSLILYTPKTSVNNFGTRPALQPI